MLHGAVSLHRNGHYPRRDQVSSVVAWDADVDVALTAPFAAISAEHVLAGTVPTDHVRRRVMEMGTWRRTRVDVCTVSYHEEHLFVYTAIVT